MDSTPNKLFSRTDVLVFATCCVACAAMVAGHWGYTLDDTYIYLQFAKNLNAGHGMAFNAGDPVYGFTSPLWLLSIAALGKCGIDLLFASKLLGALWTIASIAMFLAAARMWISDRRVAYAAALIWSTNAWLVRWAVCGIETPMAVSVFLFTLFVYHRERDRSTFRWTAPLLALAVMTRPEGALLAAVIMLDMILFAPTVRIGTLVRIGITSAVCSIVWILYAWNTFGVIMPTTIAAKSDTHTSVADILATSKRIGSIIASTCAFEFGILAALFAKRVREKISGYRILILWVLLLPLMYVTTNANVQSRYVLVVLPMLIIVGWKIIGTLFLSTKQSVIVFMAIASLVLLENQYVTWRVVKPSVAEFTRSINETFIPMGEWLVANTPKDAIVAVSDIGAVGYFSDRRILDLAGLVTPEIRTRLGAYSYEEIVRRGLYLELGRATYLIDRGDRPNRLDTNFSAPHLDPLQSWHAPSLGISSSTAGMWYTVYSVNY